MIENPDPGNSEDVDSGRDKDRAARLHRDALVFDGHADTLLGILDHGNTIAQAPSEFHIDLPRIDRGGLNVELFTAFVHPDFLARSRERATKLLDVLDVQAAKYADRLVIARSAAEVEAAVERGQCVAVPAIEGGHAIEDNLDNLREFHRRGVRLMTLTWNNSNGWADGCAPGPDDPRNGGLNDLGHRVIGEMEKLGVIVDISHAAPETFWAVEKIATRPFVASHSCAASVTPHVRNLEDDQLQAIAKHGGLVGVCFASPFLFDEAAAWVEVLESPEYAALSEKSYDTNLFTLTDEEIDLYEQQVPLATMSDLLDHIDHMVGVMGPEHVALGSDFDGVGRLPIGINDVTDLPKVTEGLMSRGYEEDVIRGILGGNWLRVLREVNGS